MVKDRNMKVMMTLFHHSAPKWALQYGGCARRREARHLRPPRAPPQRRNDAASRAAGSLLARADTAAVFASELISDAVVVLRGRFLAHTSWTRPFMIGLFREFTEIVVNELGDLVDYWRACCWPLRRASF